MASRTISRAGVLTWPHSTFERNGDAAGALWAACVHPRTLVASHIPGRT